MKSRRHSNDIYAIARQCGVKLYNGASQYRGSRGPRECYATATLRRIVRRHGVSHLALVLRLIVETNGNAGELYGETILAVSSLLEHRPELVERGGVLFEAFDSIDLAGIRRRAQQMRCGLPHGHVMRVLLSQELTGA